MLQGRTWQDIDKHSHRPLKGDTPLSSRTQFYKKFFDCLIMNSEDTVKRHDISISTWVLEFLCQLLVTWTMWCPRGMMGEGTDEQIVFLPDLLVRFRDFFVVVCCFVGWHVVVWEFLSVWASWGDQSPLHWCIESKSHKVMIKWIGAFAFRLRPGSCLQP